MQIFIFNKMKSSLMIKLILTYSAITILILSGLLYVIRGNLSDVIYNKEKSIQDQIINRVSQYVDSSIRSAKDIIQNVYLSRSDSSINIFDVLQDNGQNITFSNLSERDKFNNLFSTQLAKENNILDIIIYKNINNEVVSYSKNIRRINNDYDFFEYVWFKSLVENKDNLKIIPSYLPKYVHKSDVYVYSVATSLYDLRNKQMTGAIVINLDAGQITKSYELYKKDVKGFIMVMNMEGDVIYDSSNKYRGSKYPYFDKLKKTSGYIMLDEECMVSLDVSSKNGFIIAGIIPKDQVLNSINTVLKSIYLILFISSFFSVFMIILASRFFSKKIQKVMIAMKEVERGNLQVRVPVNMGLDEIEQIAQGFNKMCNRLSTYIDRAYLYEIKNKDAELSALQYQINPHFLYNTLESIRMEAIINNDHDVGDMIYALAYLFRTNVKIVDRFVRIRDEIEYTKSYLNLFKIRYKDRLKINLKISDHVLDYAIPKLSLQPIVENSIIHGGIDNSMEVLTIDISVHMKDEMIEFIIADDGIGMEEETLNLLEKNFLELSDTTTKGSIGLKNVSDRIKIIFGKEYGLKITSVLGEFTKFTITIPAKLVEEVNNSG